MKYLCFAFAIACVACFATADSQPPMTEPEFIRQYLESLKEAGFNKDILPEGNKGHGSPVEVRCTMYILNIYKVNDFNMDYVADFYFRQMWNDSRLSYDDKDISEVVFNDPGKIWVPDLFFVQEKQAIHHQVISPNTFIRISTTGEVKYSVRLSVTFSCPMDFTKYPHDVQKCTFSAESYGRTASKIEIEWDKIPEPVGYNENITMYNFQLTDVTQDARKVHMQTNTYSTITLTFKLQRKTGFYVTKLYLPSIMLSIISWASFWIPSKMVALRLSLLLVILYLLVCVGSEINCYAPPTSYLKGSDVWISVCVSLVFATFLQFIAVYIIARNTEKLRKRMCKSDPEAQRVLDADAKLNTGNTVSSNSAVNMMAHRLKNDDQLSKRLDKLCAIIFPIIFVIFNFIYWLVYCTGN